jgi:hypothetical protein
VRARALDRVLVRRRTPTVQWIHAEGARVRARGAGAGAGARGGAGVKFAIIDNRFAPGPASNDIGDVP